MALIILAVRNLRLSLKFYREVFEWPQVVDVPVYAEFELPYGLRLGLYSREGFGRNRGQIPFAILADFAACLSKYPHRFWVKTRNANLGP